MKKITIAVEVTKMLPGSRAEVRRIDKCKKVPLVCMTPEIIQPGTMGFAVYDRAQQTWKLVAAA